MASEAPIPVTVGNAFEKGKFFIIEPSFWGGGRIPGLEIANEDTLALMGLTRWSHPTAIRISTRSVRI